MYACAYIHMYNGAYVDISMYVYKLVNLYICTSVHVIAELREAE